MRRPHHPGKPPSRRLHHANLDPDHPADHDTILKAAACRAGIRPGGRALVIGTRVGDAEHVPPGYALALCVQCNAYVWVHADIVRNYQVVALCIDH